MFKAMGLVRLTREPVLKAVGETHVCNFGVAVNEHYTKNGEKKEISNFFECELWDKGAEVFAKYVNKGDQVVIEARPRYDSWEDADGKKRSKVFFRVDNFQLLRQKKVDEVAEPVAAEGNSNGAEEAPF
jgi:single-strand DNA-binding protein